MVRHVTAETARQLLASGATLIDIREPDEFRRAHVPGSRNIPQSRLQDVAMPDGPLLFTCRSGARTAACAASIAAVAGRDALIVEGGLEGWRRAGGTVAEDRGQPLDIMRQVQIVAGLLILAGVLLSYWVAPAFIGLSAFVGAGLLFAGLSGWCGMARLLAVMPWNRA